MTGKDLIKLAELIKERKLEDVGIVQLDYDEGQTLPAQVTLLRNEHEVEGQTSWLIGGPMTEFEVFDFWFKGSIWIVDHEIRNCDGETVRSFYY